ncbi:GNAT family N-acetyltransferase [Desulfoluna butyratoxydans]|uniref:Acyl-coa n-acyltransferase n=1 Tax=Desulfoluna butyratoxydans TaxID=231438 RepID=A0A4U8YP40_9BACT|nr:GNAT family N-acetyltransferase [Desulfoluna butyratoxydans]VFQ44969.1 acyl-coa n-acyltransferase [Desulfoluna butyratoxydans]
MDLISSRLLFRPMEERDRRFMRRFLSDGELTRWLPVDYPCPMEQVHLHVDRRLEHWDKHGFGTFVLEEREGEGPVGYCGLEHVTETPFIDLRYGLVQSAQGRGLAFEAAMRVVTYGFHGLQLPRIFGAAMPDNKASVAVLTKVGMRPDKRFDCYGSNLFTASVDRVAFDLKAQPVTHTGIYGAHG